MKKELTAAEIEKRFAEINAAKPEEMSPADAASLAKAEAMDDGTAVSLAVLRIPRSLHKALKDAAEIEGVSLNQYMIYKLSR